jgi:hypothetical protein
MTDNPSAEAVPAASQLGPRRFALIDAMILIAALAVGLAVIRYALLESFTSEEPANSSRLMYFTLYMIGRYVHGICPVLFALCAAVVVSVFRGPHRWREAIRRSPGTAACLAALVAMPVALINRVLGYAIGRYPGVVWENHPLDVLSWTVYEQFCSPRAVDGVFTGAAAAGIPAVLAVWLVQFLCGLWKPVPDWPDRLGRALGFAFLLWMLTPH